MSVKRSKCIHLRVSPDEKQALEILSTYNRRNPSEMLRELIRDGYKKQVVDTGFLGVRLSDLGRGVRDDSSTP